MKKILALVAVAGAATAANATIYRNDTPGSWVSTGSYSTTITVDAFATTLVNVGFAMTHTWSSDLNVTVTGTNGFSATLIGFEGGSADLTGGPYTFAPGGNPVWNPGAAGTYAPNSWNNNVGNGGVTYTILINDPVGGDNGNVSGWFLQVDKIPTPGSLALLGLGGLAAARRRR